MILPWLSCLPVLGWLVFKPIPQNSDETKVLDLSRDTAFSGSTSLHPYDSVHNVSALAACCAVIIHSGFWLQTPDWKLQVSSSLTVSCEVQHSLDRGTGNMLEMDKASEGYRKRAGDHSSGNPLQEWTTCSLQKEETTFPQNVGKQTQELLLACSF